MYRKNYELDVSLHSGIPKIYSHLKNKKFGDWEIPPWEVFIDTNKQLGEGSWAKVYLAEWRQTTVVAKVLKNSLDMHAKFLIIKEFQNMTKMHHPNIVQLFGYVEEPFVIIMEYFQNGDLYDNMKKLKLKQKIKIANDIIKGLIYIHERKPYSLIHRDIKPRNILLTNSYTAKIADFGLSTFSISNIIKNTSNNNLSELEKDNNINHNLLKSEEYTDNVGTERYMSPEVKTTTYDNKVDIYSCGILLYELFSNEIYLGAFKWNLPNDLKELILKMVNKDSTIRPTASIALHRLNGINFSNLGNFSNLCNILIKYKKNRKLNKR